MPPPVPPAGPGAPPGRRTARGAARGGAPNWGRTSRPPGGPARRPGGRASGPWPCRRGGTHAADGPARTRAARTGRDAASSGRDRPGRRTRPRAPSPRLTGRRLRSIFFRTGVGVGDDRRPALASPQGGAGRAPGAGELVAVAGPVEHLPEGVGRDGRQAVGGGP